MSFARTPTGRRFMLRMVLRFLEECTTSDAREFLESLHRHSEGHRFTVREQ